MEVMEIAEVRASGQYRRSSRRARWPRNGPSSSSPSTSATRTRARPTRGRRLGRRAEAADIQTSIGCHSFRATGITEYLRNGGKLEIAQAMANHESARTTGLYDRRTDQINLDEVERILI
jgi:integrase